MPSQCIRSFNWKAPVATRQHVSAKFSTSGRIRKERRNIWERTRGELGMVQRLRRTKANLGMPDPKGKIAFVETR
jgi:hypothetical protein